MPRNPVSKQLSLIPSPAAAPVKKKRRAAVSPKTRARAPVARKPCARAAPASSGPAAKVLQDALPDILRKMAELAREGDVRAASLILKMLETIPPYEHTNTDFHTLQHFLSGQEQTVAGEIVSLLAEADARAKEPPEGGVSGSRGL